MIGDFARSDGYPTWYAIHDERRDEWDNDNVRYATGMSRIGALSNGKIQKKIDQYAEKPDNTKMSE